MLRELEHHTEYRTDQEDGTEHIGAHREALMAARPDPTCGTRMEVTAL